MPQSSRQGSSARIPRLAPDSDPSRLEMNPAEGFLFSRVDGHTPWGVLREMGGMPAVEVDACLERWLARGVIDLIDDPGSAAASRSQTAPTPAAAAEFEGGLEPGLDLDLDTQRRILRFESQLDQPYHELLGVARNADSREIKRAYFKLSKEFHPDRYFRRQIGGFTQRLADIFKAVLEAYELLSDPTTRAVVEKSLDTEPRPPKAAGATGAAARPLSAVERLRQRMPFRIPPAVLAERSRKAAEFFEAALQSFERGCYLEAASSARLAIAFDPLNADFRSRFGEIQSKASAMRAAQLLEEAASYDDHQCKEALRLFEETLLYRPHDPEVNEKAAGLALSLGELDSGLDYASRAIEHSPEVALHHLTRAKIYRARRDIGHAVRDIERAIELDGSDLEARKFLASVRPRYSALKRESG